MNDDDVGKVFLLALRWDWTFVGRFVGFSGDLIVLEQAGYFTRTGATFDQLAKKGFTAETSFHAALTPRGRVCVANEINVKWEWEAAWPQKAKR